MGMEPRKKEEAGQMSGSRNDQRVVIPPLRTNPNHKWGEILALRLRNHNSKGTVITHTQHNALLPSGDELEPRDPV